MPPPPLPSPPSPQTKTLISTSLPPSLHQNFTQNSTLCLTPTPTPPSEILRVCGFDVDIWIPPGVACGSGGGGVGIGMGVIVDTEGMDEDGDGEGGMTGDARDTGDISINPLLLTRIQNAQTSMNLNNAKLAVAVVCMERFSQWQIELYLCSSASNLDILLLPLPSPPCLLPALEKLLPGMNTATLGQHYSQQHQHQHQQQQSRRPLALLAQMSSSPPLRVHTTYVLHDMYPSIATLARDVTVEKLRMVVGERPGEQEEAERVLRFLEREWEVQE